MMLLFSSCLSAPDQKSVMLNMLSEISSSDKIMFGHQDSYFYGHTWTREKSDTLFRSDVKDVCSDYPAVLGCDLGNIELGSDRNLDGVPFDTMRDAIIFHHNLGGVVTVSWHSRNPVTDGDSWDVSNSSCIRSILPGGSHHEKYILWLDKAGEFLQSINQKSGESIPIIFRPYHEHTGNWFWWGSHDSETQDYIRLWKMTHQRMTTKWGLTQLIWAYSPNLGVDKAGYMERYPGDDMVDLLGFDIYQIKEDKGNSTTVSYTDNSQYIRDLEFSLGFLKELGEEHNKPVAFTETGSESIPYPQWWSEVLYKTIRNYPLCYVLVWRNAHDKPEHHYAPYPGHPSEEDFQKFYRLPETLFLKDLLDTTK